MGSPSAGGVISDLAQFRNLFYVFAYICHRKMILMFQLTLLKSTNSMGTYLDLHLWLVAILDVFKSKMAAMEYVILLFPQINRGGIIIILPVLDTRLVIISNLLYP